MKKRKIGVGVGVITALILGNVFPATAKQVSVIGSGGRVLATASFNAQSDTFRVDDIRKDGRGAYVFWRVATFGTGTCKDDNGAGTPPKTCRYNFPANKDIEWVLCAIDVNGSVRTVCTPLVREKT
jgi:hypothetical protein